MNLRSFFLQVHLWLGLATGLVVSIVCFTGALLAFEEEVQEVLHSDRYFVEQARERLPLREAADRVQADLPGTKIGGVTVHDDPRRSLELPGGRGESIFANPYTGQELAHYRYQDTYFFTIFALHRWLLGGDTGKRILGVCTLLFLVILVSGVWVWWPKNRRQSSHERAEAPPSTYQAGREAISLDEVYDRAVEAVGPSPYYRVSLPRDSASALAVRALSSSAPHDHASSTVYLDQYTGDVLGVHRFADRTAGRQARATFYAIHVGSIYGMPTRILAFVASLLGAFFPITGALVWYNKRWKRWRRQWREWRSRT